VAKYPTTPDKLNLSYFKYLKDLYGDKIRGISTHEAPNEAISGALAFSMGARIFEKHIGLQSGTYLLNEYSVDLDNAKVWLSNLKDAIIRVGSIDARNQFLKYEKENLSLFKRGAFLKKNVNKKKDDQLTIKDVNFFYPAQNGQLLSNDFSKFNNFKLIKKVKENQPLFLKDLKILNTRNAIQVIRNKIANLIYRSKVIIKKKNVKIEISHHYGLQNYYSFGMSMITIFNEKYCKKLLFLLYKQKHPDQYHKKKQETFFVLFGKIKLNLKVKKKNFSYHLKPGEIFTIKAGVIHNFESISKEGSVIEELSTHSNSNDSYYLDKKISKNSERKSFISLY
jgi:mannose-6-phosphate isomerase-like protein (cupin superfamily)